MLRGRKEVPVGYDGRGSGRILIAIGWLLVCALSQASPATARQAGLVASCENAALLDPAACLLVVQTLEMLQPRFGLALAGGNPVPGNYSTLGVRLGSSPRSAVSVRSNVLWTRAPGILKAAPSRPVPVNLLAFNFDAAIGLIPGATSLPGVGGIGAVDLLATTGIVVLPRRHGFQRGSAASLGAGLRLGILRESFVVPGISVSVIYRRLATITFGDPALQDTEACLRTAPGVVALRGGVSKQLFGVGLGLGVGHDRSSSDVSFGFRDENGLEHRFQVPGHVNRRSSVFASFSLTRLILQTAGEIGWQWGGSPISPDLPGEMRPDPSSGALLVGLGFRLTI